MKKRKRRNKMRKLTVGTVAVVVLLIVSVVVAYAVTNLSQGPELTVVAVLNMGTVHEQRIETTVTIMTSPEAPTPPPPDVGDDEEEIFVFAPPILPDVPATQAPPEQVPDLALPEPTLPRSEMPPVSDIELTVIDEYESEEGALALEEGTLAYESLQVMHSYEGSAGVGNPAQRGWGSIGNPAAAVSNTAIDINSDEDLSEQDIIEYITDDIPEYIYLQASDDAVPLIQNIFTPPLRSSDFSYQHRYLLGQFSTERISIPITLHDFGEDTWSVANLILSILGIILAVITIVITVRKKQANRTDKPAKIKLIKLVIPTITGVLLFTITQGIVGQPVWINLWTITHIVLVGTIALPAYNAIVTKVRLKKLQKFG